MRTVLSTITTRKRLAACSVFLATVLLTMSGFQANRPGRAETPIQVFSISASPSEAIAHAALRPETLHSDAGQIHTIVMSNGEPFYAPQSLVIEVGEVVKWVNVEHSDTHSIHARTGQLDSPDVKAGSEWCFRFAREGEYTYTCRFHPWMRGTILVKPRNVEATPVALSPEVASAAYNLESAGGAVWLIAQKGSPLLVQVAADGVVTRHRLPARLQAGTNLCFTADQRFSFIDGATGKLSEFDLTRGSARTRTMSPAGSKLRLLAASKLGELWLFDAASGSFLSCPAASEQLTQPRAVKISSPPIKTLIDQAGKLWFIEESRKCAGFFDPRSGQFKEYLLPEMACLVALDVTPAGQAWFADAGRNKIIKIADGWVTEYTVPTAYSAPQGLTTDEQGNVWFTESLTNKIGRLKDGHFDEYRLPDSLSHPMALGRDARGNLLFTLQMSTGLGRIAAATVGALLASDQDQNDSPCSTAIDQAGSQEHRHDHDH